MNGKQKDIYVERSDHRIYINDLRPSERRIYRRLRQGGFNRHDANMVMVGVAISHGLVPQVELLDGAA